MADYMDAWMTGIFEGEGCIAFVGKHSVCLRVNMTDEDVVRSLHSVAGFGTVGGPYRSKSKVKPFWNWQTSNQDAVKALLKRMLPLLGARRKEKAEAALKRLEHVRRTGFCKRGHQMSGENLYVAPGGPEKYCLTCMRLRQSTRTYAARHRGEWIRGPYKSKRNPLGALPDRYEEPRN